MTTEYVVLAQDTSGYWSELDMQHAATAHDAIAASVEEEGIYVAVPSRSWRPAALKVEMVRRKRVRNTNGDTPQPKESD